MDNQDLYSQNETLEVTDDNILMEINKFNWGAFAFGWIWGLAHGVYKKTIMPCIGLFIGWFLFGGIPFLNLIFWLVFLCVHIYFGKNGNLWAWDANEWKSIHHFNAREKAWACGATVYCTFVIVCFFIFPISLVGVLKSRQQATVNKATQQITKTIELNSAIAYIVTSNPEIMNSDKNSIAIGKLAQYMDASFKKKNNGKACNIYNSNTIKISEFDKTSGKYLPKSLFSVNKKGNCEDLQAHECYVTAYTVQDGRAKFVVKTYFNNKGQTSTPNPYQQAKNNGK